MPLATDIIFIILLFYACYYVMFHLVLWFENRDKFFTKKQLKISSLPYISLIIPAYNEDSLIAKTLKKVKEIDYPKNKLEVIVVDDGSKDKTYEIAKRFNSSQIKVFTKPNGGKASALNFGIERAKNEFIAVMDADSYLAKDALKNCIKYFDEKDVAAVTSHVFVGKKSNFWERMQNTELMLVNSTRKIQEFANVINATPGPLSIYRKNVLIKLGKFDEKNLIEDVEIDWRILRNGYKVKMAFDAIVYSIYPASFRKWWNQRVRWAIGGLQTLFKYISCIGNKKTYGVGSFVAPTSLLGYSCTVIGIGIFVYLLLVRIFYFLIYTFKSFSLGINPFAVLEFAFHPDIKLIIGFLVLLVSLFLLRIAFSLHQWKVKWYDIIFYITIYSFFFPFISIYGMYKYIRKERGWLTK
jgi:cellulose synthase/poly-beta-1,6-N-acetylglucosamine synthase-like glycosyltransferase